MRIFYVLSSWFRRPDTIRAATVPDGYAQDRERVLLAQLRAGDEQAFAALVTQFDDSLTRYAYAFVNDADAARDIVQDAFAKLWEDRESIVPVTTLEKYVFGAVRFRALHYLRRQRLEAQYAPAVDPDAPASFTDGPYTHLERADLYEQALRTVEELPPRARLVFALRWGEGLSYAHIAERLGISVKGVEIQMTRALAFLRERLRQ